MISDSTVGRDYDIRGLTLVGRFGWIRAQELGNLLRAQAIKTADWRVAFEAARKVGENQVSKWQERGWIVARKLPDRAGKAVVLSDEGRHYLESVTGQRFRRGADFGRTAAGRWHPPLSWRHDLLATMLVSYLHVQTPNSEFRTERELRLIKPRPTKIPDALFRSPTETIWIEAEGNPKKGMKMKGLATWLTKIQRGQAPVLDGLSATWAVVALDVDQVDWRDYFLDHMSRVSRALSKHIQAELQATFVAMRLGPSNMKLEEIEFIHQLVRPEQVTKFTLAGFKKTAEGPYEMPQVDPNGEEWRLRMSSHEGGFYSELLDPDGKLHPGRRANEFESACKLLQQEFERLFKKRPPLELESNRGASS